MIFFIESRDAKKLIIFFKAETDLVEHYMAAVKKKINITKGSAKGGERLLQEYASLVATSSYKVEYPMKVYYQ